MFELLALCLSLAGLLVIHTLTMLLVTLVWRLCSRFTESWAPSIRAKFLFLLCVTPAVAAVFCVGALFLPAYLSHEPRQTTEVVTVKLGALAALSVYVIGFALWRGFAAFLATRRLIKNWIEHAESVVLNGVTIPAYRFQHPFPVIAIIGVLRPKLFVANQILQTLNTEELAAAVAHEKGHLAAGDNIKRGLLRCCRDIHIVMPLGRALDRAWTDATELAADEHAARGGASVALNLASALVKVARLAPLGGRPAMLAGASLISQDQTGISARVLRLTQLAAHSGNLPPANLRPATLAIRAGFSGLLFAAMVMIYSSNFLAVIHSAMECVVSVLQ